MKQPCVYILASRKYGTLYIGVTSDLIARLHQHRSDSVEGFTAKYAVHRLARFELFGTMYDAITGVPEWTLKQVQGDTSGFRRLGFEHDG